MLTPLAQCRHGAVRLRAFFTQTLTLISLILLVVAVEEVPVRIAFRREDVGGDAVEEPAVVRDHQHAAGEFEQRIFQRAQRFHVVVVKCAKTALLVFAGSTGRLAHN